MTRRTFTAEDDRGGRRGSPRSRRSAWRHADRSSAPSGGLRARGRTGRSPSCSRRGRPARRRCRPARSRRRDSSTSSGARTIAPFGTFVRRLWTSRGESARGSVFGSGLQCARPCTKTGSTNAQTAARPSVWCSRSGGRRSARKTTSETAPPTTAIHVASAGPAVAQAVVEVAGPERCTTIPATSASGTTSLPPGDQRRDAREGERERDEAGQPARLRQRHRVREVHEEPRDERQQQDDQRRRRA